MYNCGKGPDLGCVDSHTNLYLCGNRTHTHTSICVSGNYHNPCEYQCLLPVWHFASSFDMRYIGTPCTLYITHIFATSYEPTISKKKNSYKIKVSFLDSPSLIGSVWSFLYTCFTAIPKVLHAATTHWWSCRKSASVPPNSGNVIISHLKCRVHPPGPHLTEQSHTSLWGSFQLMDHHGHFNFHYEVLLCLTLRFFLIWQSQSLSWG